MSAAGLRLRHLTFSGPNLEPAFISFEAGLNVIYGASNTGKSFIVDTIDFMLGGKGPLRDIPERVGYDRVLLAMETLDGQEFTIRRSTSGELSKYTMGFSPKPRHRERARDTRSSITTAAMITFQLICFRKSD